MSEKKHPGGVYGIGIILIIILLSYPVVAVGELLEIHIDVSEVGSERAGIHTQYAFSIDWDDVYANPDVTYEWDMPFIVDIRATNQQEITLALLHSLHVKVKADPIVELGFDVEAIVNDMLFTITADVLTFDAITDPVVNASAVIEEVVPGTLTGAYPDSKAYRSFYNGTNVFADLIDTPITGVGPFGESSGWQQISGPVSSLHGEWQFTLTGDGRANGNATFETPEPASILLLGLGGLALLRKRRV